MCLFVHDDEGRTVNKREKGYCTGVGNCHDGSHLVVAWEHNLAPEKAIVKGSKNEFNAKLLYGAFIKIKYKI